MKRLLICALLGSVLAMPAFAAKKSGDSATDFAAPASLAGKEFKFSLKDAREGSRCGLLLSRGLYERVQC